MKRTSVTRSRRRAAERPNDLQGEMLEAVVPALKAHGVGAPVDQLMKAAGLTSGALYSNFKNKQDLCTQAICIALDQVLNRYRAVLTEHGSEGLGLIVDEYLSEAHVSGIATGCPFAALGSDMAKAGAAAKRAFESRTLSLVDLFAEHLASGTPIERRARAQYVLSTMLGAVTFARTMRDPTAVNDLLVHVTATVKSELLPPSAVARGFR
jgi:TetR/AcrR family transcriptional repressor of nem operon